MAMDTFARTNTVTVVGFWRSMKAGSVQDPHLTHEADRTLLQSLLGKRHLGTMERMGRIDFW